MAQMVRPGLSAAQKRELWQRWKAGQSLNTPTAGTRSKYRLAALDPSISSSRLASDCGRRRCGHYIARRGRQRRL